MSGKESSLHPILLYRLLAVLALPSVMYYVALVISFLVESGSETVVPPPLLFTIVHGLIVAPSTILVGLLIIRRSSGNLKWILTAYLGDGNRQHRFKQCEQHFVPDWFWGIQPNRFQSAFVHAIFLPYRTCLSTTFSALD